MIDPWIQFFFAAAGAALASFLITRWMRRIALQMGIVDIPNARSSHVRPIPRGGGVGIIAGFLLIVLVLTHQDLFPAPAGWVISLGTLSIAALGWMDDTRRLSATVRLTVQVLIASAVVYALGGFPQFRFGSWLMEWDVFGSILSIVGLVWLINLYNFMDGIDGLAASQASVAGLGITGISASLFSSQIGFSLVAVGLAASSVAFLYWNWPPAQIFMGDVASGTLGFIFGVLALVSEMYAGPPLIVWLLLLGLFVTDTTLTLIDRWRHGERVTEAHRDHLYQRLVRAGFSHRQVTLSAIGLNVVVLWPAAWISARHMHLAPWIFISVFSVLAVLWWMALRWCKSAGGADKKGTIQ